MWLSSWSVLLAIVGGNHYNLKVVFWKLSDSLSSLYQSSFSRHCLCHYWAFVFSVWWSGRLGYIRQWAEWRRAGEEEKNFTGTAGCTLMITLLLLFYCIRTPRQTCIPLPVLVTSAWTDCVRQHLSLVFMGMCYTELIHLFWWLIRYQETDRLINRSMSGCLFVAFVSLEVFFLVDSSCTCFPLPIIFIFN